MAEESIKRKPGRPYAKDPTQPVSVRMTKAQHAKYIELGGARWLKRMLDQLATYHAIDKAQ